jgi:hypothetical protein
MKFKELEHLVDILQGWDKTYVLSLFLNADRWGCTFRITHNKYLISETPVLNYSSDMREQICKARHERESKNTKLHKILR